MTFKFDISLKNFYFFNCAVQMFVNWLILHLLNILLWILQKVQLVWSRIIGSSAILDFLIWNFLSSIFVYKLVLPVSHIGFYISFFFPYFKLKWFESSDSNQLELIWFVVGTLYFKYFPIDFNGNVKYF